MKSSAKRRNHGTLVFNHKNRGLRRAQYHNKEKCSVCSTGSQGFVLSKQGNAQLSRNLPPVEVPVETLLFSLKR